MTFKTEAVDDFMDIFRHAQPKISAFPGCNHVELIQDLQRPEVMMTYSLWDSPEALENYRHSELFQTTWAKTKVLFNDKPEAWSLEKVKTHG